MAKAVPLTLETMNVPQITPAAATPARSAAPKPAAADSAPVRRKKAEKVNHVPFQIRVPAELARAVKIAAAERDQSISAYVVECLHAYMPALKK